LKILDSIPGTKKQNKIKPGEVAHICNPSTWEKKLHGNILGGKDSTFPRVAVLALIIPQNIFIPLLLHNQGPLLIAMA
jgi:hypothetical protein